MKKVGIVCCSNGQLREDNVITELESLLRQSGFAPVFSDFIYQKESVFSGTGKERAKALMDFYKDREIEEIFDISGGDIANEILPYLDYSVIRNNPKRFWGYSDLTTVINSIYAETGISSVLYQVKNLVRCQNQRRISEFLRTVNGEDQSLFSIACEFVQGKNLKGITVGGNIRCLLKLAGTRYWPDMRGKILVLEALSGRLPQIVTYLNQLEQMGVFRQVQGVLLGTFTELGKDKISASRLTQRYIGADLPLAVTGDIGHGYDAKGIIIGEEVSIHGI